MFSDVLRQLRLNANLNQEELAKKLGCSKSAISMYENGTREPNLETLEAIADYFNVDMNTLTDSKLLLNLIQNFRNTLKNSKTEVKCVCCSALQKVLQKKMLKKLFVSLRHCKRMNDYWAIFILEELNCR